MIFYFYFAFAFAAASSARQSWHGHRNLRTSCVCALAVLCCACHLQFFVFLRVFRPLGSGEALESRILAEHGSEMAENGAGKVSRRSVRAVAPSSASMSPWGCMGNPFGTELVPKWDHNLWMFIDFGC